MIRGGYWGGAWGLSWAGAWGEAWLLLNQPYQELSLKGQVFVRSYLTRIHSVEVAEQIVAVAALNNISVVDAQVVIAAKCAAQHMLSISNSPFITIDDSTLGLIATSYSNNEEPQPDIFAIARNYTLKALKSDKQICHVSTQAQVNSVGKTQQLFAEYKVQRVQE